MSASMMEALELFHERSVAVSQLPADGEQQAVSERHISTLWAFCFLPPMGGSVAE